MCIRDSHYPDLRTPSSFLLPAHQVPSSYRHLPDLLLPAFQDHADLYHQVLLLLPAVPDPLLFLPEVFLHLLVFLHLQHLFLKV